MRPLNGMERWFCDEPGRTFGEAKLIGLACTVSFDLSSINITSAIETGAQGANRQQRLSDVATAAWVNVVRAFPYLRCRVQYVDGAPHLDEPTQDDFIAQLGDIAAVNVIDTEGATSEEALEQTRGVPFDETKAMGAVTIAVTSWERGDAAVMVTLSHISADARSVFAVARAFFDDMSQCLSSSSGLVQRDPGPLVDLFGALGIQRIVQNPLRPPIVPEGLPPLLPPVESDTPRDAVESVRLGSVVRVIPSTVFTTMLAASKAYHTSIQCIFSAAGSLATLQRSEPAFRDLLATSPDRAITIGCQATVQLRDTIEPRLAPNSVVLGGSVVWVFIPIGYATTFLDMVQAIYRELRIALDDGRVVGFFKMYLAPPPWAGAGSTQDGERVEQVNRQQSKYQVTYNFTNIGINALSNMMDATPSPSCSSDSATSGNNKQREAAPSSVTLHTADMDFRLCTRMQPPHAYMRTHGSTLNGSLRFSVSYTKPCFTDETAKSFADSCVEIATNIAESYLQEEEVKREGLTAPDTSEGLTWVRRPIGEWLMAR